MGFLKHFPYPSLTNTIQQQLNQFQIIMNKGREMAESGEPDSFRKALKIGKKLDSDLDPIELKIKKLVNVGQIGQTCLH